MAGCEWLRKGQVESSAALDLGLCPLVVGTLWVLWEDPRVALGQRRSTQRPVPFWRESLVSLIPRLKMHFHGAEWWGAGSGLGG